MSIRRGGEADIAKVSRLWLRMVNEMRPEWTPNVDWWRKIATANIRSGIYALHVADEGGKIVGFVDFFMFSEPSTGKIHAVGQHMFLLPEYRGKGVGNELYGKAFEAALGMKAQVIELFCFDEERPKWEGKGFAPVRNLMRKEV